jgi:heat shock protein beta
VPVEEEDEAETDATDDAADDAAADEDDDDDDDEVEAVKTKKVKRTVTDWELVNDAKALWTRTPSEISEDEYQAFYKTLSKVRRPLACAPEPRHVRRLGGG